MCIFDKINHCHCHCGDFDAPQNMGHFRVIDQDQFLSCMVVVQNSLDGSTVFYMMAYGLLVNEDEWGADICSHPPFCCSILDVSTLAFILPSCPAAVQIEERFLQVQSKFTKIQTCAHWLVVLVRLL